MTKINMLVSARTYAQVLFYQKFCKLIQNSYILFIIITVQSVSENFARC